MASKFNEKWEALPQGAQILLIIVFLLIVGPFLFLSGKSIGAAIYRAVS